MVRSKVPSSSRRVVIFALPGALSLDVLGPFEIFVGAARLVALRSLPPGFDFSDLTLLDRHQPAYDVVLAGARVGPLASFSGAPLSVTDALDELHGPVDTLIVAGGDLARMLKALADQPALKSALRRIAKRARRVASVCTGAFVLAAAGLLDGRRATTHWAACELLQSSHPDVRVEREPIYTQDGNVYTSAGATTGMDLALALVREDLGSEVAREIARWLVLYVERSGSQPQLSQSLRAQVADRKPLRDLQLWIAEHLREDLSVSALAAQVGMSVRNFARAFKREMSITPAAYVEGLRVEAAQRKLELGTPSLAEVARDVGFGSVDTLRRAFVRATGQPPRALRLLDPRSAS
ncbi:MAG TPA: DJ-1/PfpI family protein [Polyangiales bacterium]|nr:DJ-1/PfpI family protein [Polyangiales bacterium]